MDGFLAWRRLAGSWYHRDTMYGMAMTLRLEADEERILAEQAAAENRSQAEIIRSALREYVDRRVRADKLNAVLEEELPRYAEALRRLGE